MIGQINLLNSINKYNINTFPKTALFIGEKGCGKHTLIEYIQKNILKLPLFDISNNISDEYINNIYCSPNPAIYLINVDSMTEKEQNVLLKFIEEPTRNAYVVLLAENKNTLLDTVLNRCFLFEFENYTLEELQPFVKNIKDDKLLTHILRTPGKIINNEDSIQEIYNICSKIANNIGKANYSNTLTLVNKINYKDEYDKFDLDVFLDTLMFVLFEKYLQENNDVFLQMYLFTVEERKKLIDKRINAEIFMQHYFTKLWKLSRKN